MSKRNSCGFTLVELMAVLAISALLAGGAVLSLRGHTQAARLEDAVGRLIVLDRQLRDHARRYGRGEQLTISPVDGRIAAREPGSDSPPLAWFRFDGRVMIDRVVTQGGRSHEDTVTIDYTPQGRSPSFAVRFRGPQEKSQWLLVAGITGQALRLDSQQDMEEVFSHVSTSRNDAD